MKVLRTISIFALLGAGAALSGALANAYAGQEEGPGGIQAPAGRLGPGPRLRARVHRALNLSPEQEGQLKALREELQQQLQAIRAQVREGALAPEEGRARFREAVEAQRTARDEILTAEQKTLLERVRQHLERRRSDAHLGRRGHRFARLAATLGLSDEQKQQWRALLQQQREEMKLLRQADQKPGPEDIRRFREEHRQAFEEILTPEQREKLARIRERLQQRRGGAVEGEAGDSAPELAPKEAPTAVEAKSWGEIKSEVDEK